MKTKIIFFLLSVFFTLTIPLHAQQDAFHPFLQDGKTWVVKNYGFGYRSEDGVYHSTVGDRIDYIAGDTVINDKVWKKCISNYPDGENFTFYAALRHEGEQILMVIPGETKERLLYDYGLKPGDVLYRAERNQVQFLLPPDAVPQSEEEWAEADFFCRPGIDNMELQSIDTIQLNGSLLRRFVFKSEWALKSPQRRINAFPYPQLVWIEGIGSEGGLFSPWRGSKDQDVSCRLDGRTLIEYEDFFAPSFTPLPEAMEDPFHPFLQDGKTWVVKNIGFGYRTEDGAWQTKKGDQIEYVSGDTVINDKVWKKCFTNRPAGEALSYYAALRQEGEQILMVIPGETKERLLYDFGINPGDFFYRVSKNEYDFLIRPEDVPEPGEPHDYFYRKIDKTTLLSVDTICVDGILLRRFVFDSNWMLKSPRRRAHYYYDPEVIWVEGVGSEGGLFRPYTPIGQQPVEEGGLENLCLLDDQTVFEYVNFFAPAYSPLTKPTQDTAFSLFSRLADASDAADNLCLSPLSAQIALSMVANGADGNTLREMKEALGTSGYSNEETNAFYKSLTASLTNDRPLFNPNEWKLNDSYDDEYALNRFNACYPVCEIANSVWFRPEINLYESFMDLLTDSYNAGFGNVQFDTEEGIAVINNWVNDKTHGSIPRIYDGPQPPDLAVVLADALYFKGSWTTPFEKTETKPEVFHAVHGDVENVEMMSAKSRFRLSENGKFRAVTLPYGVEGHFSMTLFLPSEGTDLPELTRDDWAMTMNQLTTTLVSITMPKFNMDGKYDLIPVLHELGITEAFGGNADFSKMSDWELFISKVLLLSKISVDEDGTAVAATSVMELVLNESPEPDDYEDFRVDRPFYFTIENRKEQTVLFVGRVTTLPDTPATRFDGDVNNDGETNISDIVTIINVMAGKDANTGTDMNAPAAVKAKSDVNHDGKTDISDIAAVINIMAGQK